MKYERLYTIEEAIAFINSVKDRLSPELYKQFIDERLPFYYKQEKKITKKMLLDDIDVATLYEQGKDEEASLLFNHKLAENASLYVENEIKLDYDRFLKERAAR